MKCHLFFFISLYFLLTILYLFTWLLGAVIADYDEATQEKVIEAFSGLGFTDDCMDYLKVGKNHKKKTRSLKLK